MPLPVPFRPKHTNQHPACQPAGELSLPAVHALLRTRGYELEIRCGIHLHAVRAIAPDLRDERHLCCQDELAGFDANTFCQLVEAVFARPGWVSRPVQDGQRSASDLFPASREGVRS